VLRDGQSQQHGSLQLDTSTLSAAGSLLKISCGPQGIAGGLPLSVFADRSVFAPPLRSGSSKSPTALVSLNGPILEQKALQWWESHCGHAADLQTLLVDGAPAEPADFIQGWRDRWGANQVVAPLIGPQGVLLAKELPTRPEDRTKIEPVDFQLHPASRAAVSDAGMRPIGAPLGTMTVPPLRGAPSASSGSKGKQAKPPAPVKPVF
jgi:hypothetical protein